MRTPIPNYATPPATPTAPDPAPLTPDQLFIAKRAHDRAKKIRRAAGVARLDAIVTGLFALLSLASVLFDASAIVISVALLAVAFNSFRGASRLRRFDPSAPKLLALNQLFLAFCIICYAAVAIWQVQFGNSQILSALVGDKASMAALSDAGVDVKSILAFAKNVMTLTYGALIVGTLAAQGFTAWYYWSRKPLLETYLEQTPSWAIELQKHQA